MLNQLTTFLARPDVSRKPLLYLSRRLYLSFLDRMRPHLLMRERMFGVADGYKVQLPLNDTVARELYVHGAFEYGVGRQILKAAGSAGTIIDVGAHVGTFTLLAARNIGAYGKILAVEPNPASRRRLNHHLALNGVQHKVVVSSDAVLDREMETTLGSPSVLNSGMSQLGVAGTTVKCRRLDDVVLDLDLNQVSLIKIDVEGVEAEVIQGASEIIRRDQPLIVAELNDRRVVKLLVEEFGYSIQLINEDGTLRPLPEGVHGPGGGMTMNILGTPEPEGRGLTSRPSAVHLHDTYVFRA